MTTARKKRDYLSALDSPLLSRDRRCALTLMSMVREVKRDRKRFPAAIDVKQEALRQTNRLECVNCEKKIDNAALYCGDYCQQLAGIIRYIRKAVVEDRLRKKDMQEGIGITLLMLSGGGYPRKQRALAKEVRQTILKRDDYTCQNCGEPADQVDHISGNSDKPSNLRALCADCNRGKAFDNARVATLEEAKKIEKMYSEMALRIAAPKPLYLCDDYENWNKFQGAIRGARRTRVRELEEEAKCEFEDVDGYLADAMAKDD